MEKIWLKSYPPGVPSEINPNAFSSLSELIDQTCNEFADHQLASNFGRSLSYRQINALSRDLAAYLQSCGLKKGDRFAIMVPNLLQYYVALFAAIRIGLVVVNVNPLYTPRELVQELSDAKVETIIIAANFAHNLQKALPKTEINRVIVTEIGDLLTFPKSLILNWTLRYIKKMVPRYYFDRVISFREALRRGKKLQMQPVAVTAADPAFLQYTGGTTGIPKAAVLSHGNMLANIEQALAWISGDQYLKKAEEVCIVPLPLYHIFSLTCALCFFKLGATSYLITNPHDISGMVKTLSKIKFTIFVGINTLYNAMLNNSVFQKFDFKSLKLAIAGGAAMQAGVAERWQKLTAKPIIEGYGLTEASPIVTVNPINQTQFKHSIGLPVPSTEVCIRNDGVDLPAGEEGELCVKGPQVMQQYWRKPEETAKVFTEDGWLRTGDIACYDAEGYFYLVDRKKDMILVSGFNVYPNEVEEVLANCPGILEAAVIGVPSRSSGETVKAFIVKKDPNLSEKTIREYCRQQLTGYKIPRAIEFVDSLPKSNVGKVLRKELRAREKLKVSK